jgi:hypothetical protein
MDGDDSIKNLATSVDTMLGVAASGVVTIPTTASNVAVSVTVTYPAGRFTTAPPVTLTSTSNANPDWFHVSVNGNTATGFTAWGVRSSGTANFQANWIAQKVN